MYAFRPNQHASIRCEGTETKCSSPKTLPKTNGTNILQQVAGQPEYNRHRYTNFKPLDERSGVLKCRVLDMLEKEPTNNTNTSNESDSYRLGGFTYRRGWSVDERERNSRSRAAELSTQYELSETRNTELNRKAIIREPLNSLVPTLGNHMLTVKQAVKLVSQECDGRLSKIANRKGSFDATQKTRKNKQGFPRRGSSTSKLDERRTVRNAESRYDNENRIPNFIQYDTVSGHQKILEEKPAIVRRTNLEHEPYMNTPNNQIRSINMPSDLPELC
jgi:hypothetical protein